jgi:pilus assembly protein Flp/PilA
MNGWTALISSFARDERGTTTIEYGLIATLVVIGVIALIDQIGASLLGMFSAVADGFA